ncbi:MAG: glycosyltransferase family 4 protein [Endomicrobiales bacterium]|nr:glycosyltransferase family 4 protein [Endomicrobiales bacterium]
MKIALVVRAYHKRGGISLVAAELAENYAETGHDVHVFTSSWENTANAAITFHKVPVMSLGILKNLKWFALNNVFEISSFALMSLFRIKKGRYDVVHANGDYFGYFDVCTAHSCHKAWLRFFLKENRSLLERVKKSALNPLHFIVLFIERHNYRKAKRIIAVSEGVKREILSNYSVNAGAVEVIPNGINTEKFSGTSTEKKGEARKKAGICADEFIAVFPAHEFRRKGLLQVIEAVKGLRDRKLKVFVIGRDDPSEYRKLIERYGIKDKFVFTGPTEAIGDYYAAADAMLLPTSYEPFGLVILEAMASGLPVIVSKEAGASELILKTEDGMLLEDHRNPEEIRAKLEKLMDDERTRINIGEKARAKAAKYSWRLIAGRHIELYGEVARSR